MNSYWNKYLNVEEEEVEKLPFLKKIKNDVLYVMLA